MILSLAIERDTAYGTLMAVIYKHVDANDEGTEVDVIEGLNFMELMWSVSDIHPDVIAVRHDGKLDFPDEISVGEAAECVFWEIIKGEPK